MTRRYQTRLTAFVPLITILTGVSLSTSAQQQVDCVRGIPKPLLTPPPGVARETFTIKANGTAVENWTPSDTIKVAITQTGCSDFVATYRFFDRGDNHPIGDRKYWLLRSTDLLQSLPFAPDQNAVVDRMADAIRTHINGHSGPIRMSETETIETKIVRGRGTTVISIAYVVTL
jgi:hypothetical protein